MENIILKERSQKKIQSLIDSKDEVTKNLQEEVQKAYQERLKSIESQFTSQLEAFIAGIVTQEVAEDDDTEYILTKDPEDGFILKPKENGDIQHDTNKDD